MGKKTIVPVKSRGYKVIQETLELTSSTTQTVVFPGRVAIILYRVLLNSGSTSYGVFNYKYDKNSSFFAPFIDFINNPLLTSNPTSYRNGGSQSIACTKVDDYTYNFISVGYGITKITYMVILEDNLEDEIRPIFLLNGTIVHTDGTITSEVADSIQTLETNKYKIKANTLVNISNATYINLSN